MSGSVTYNNLTERFEFVKDGVLIATLDENWFRIKGQFWEGADI